MSAVSYAGILLALVATTAYNVGLILEKRALGQMPALDIRRVLRVIGSLMTSRAWLAGFALMLTGLACQTIALTFEPVSVVQPVLASGVVLVLVLSRLVLRERLHGGETWCVAAIAVSVVLLAMSATGAKDSHHASPGWVAAVMVPSAVVGLVFAAGALRARRRGTAVAGVWLGVGTGLLYGVAALAIKALSGILVRHETVASIVIAVLTSPYLYVLGGSLAVAMLLFQAALQAGRASIVVPVSNVTGSVYFIIAGTWLFHEHLPASPVRLGLRLAGIALAVLVLVVLGRQAPERVPAPPRTVPRRCPGAGRGEETVMALEDALLEILVCPIDKRGLLYFADDAALYNPRLRRLYRIENDIPLMLPKLAVPVPDEEHNRLMKCARRGEVTAITAGEADMLAGDLL